MTMQYKKAVRENTNVLIALAGGTGSGKTFSAMLLATGICNGEPFAMIDTEGRRGLHYADRFDFEHHCLSPPFTPSKYSDEVVSLAKRGFKTILIDSMSHEWEGEGGVIEMADAEQRKAPSNWIKPKAAHKRMMNKLLQAETNLIFCLRAQEKIKINDKGQKIVIENAGWQPICERRFMFEMTASFTLESTGPGILEYNLPHKIEDQHRMAFPPGQHITEEAGRILGNWVRGDKIETPDTDLWNKARIAANEGKAELKRFVENDITQEERTKLKPIGAELNATAKKSDLNTAGAVEMNNGNGETINDQQAADLNTLLHDAGFLVSDFVAKFGIDKVSELPADKMKEAVFFISPNY